MKKRIIALTLCIVMLLSAVPMAVSAQTAQSREGKIKKDIMISSLDLDNRKVEFVGVSDEDMNKVSLDFDKIKLETMDDSTIVDDALVQQGCVKIRGVVTENMYTSLDWTKAIDTSVEETVEIRITDAFDTANKDFQDTDSTTAGIQYEIRDYLVGTTNAADYLGMSVVAYVKRLDSNDYEIVSIAADTARNDILEIELTQFNQINGATGKFEYFKSAEAATATAVVLDANGVNVVYNNDGGYAIADIFGDEIANAGATEYGGKVTLIDNNTTNGYDVIFVELAETAVVDEAEDGYVAFKEMTSVTGLVDLVIDEDAEDCVVNITKDGKEISASDLKEWDVLSIIANADGSYIKAEVISTTFLGIVKSVYRSITSATDYAYTIENTKYDVAAGAYGIADLCIGAGGTFYIDKYGKIAAFKEDYALASGITVNYAYITATTIDTDILTGANTAIVQMVTADGITVYHVKATNAKINNVVFDADAASAAATLTALENTVVKYTKNSSDLITSITAADVEDDFVSAAQSGSQTYDAKNGKFDNFYLDADALVFFIAADAEDCFLGSVADLEDETPYTVMALYADDKAEDNNILVVRGGVGTISPKTNMGVLTSISTSRNEDGESIYAVEVMVNGETIAANTTADAYNAIAAGALTVGDIVKVKVGSDYLISSIEIVYNFAEGVRTFDATTLTNNAVTATEGTPSTVKEEYVGGKVTSYKESSTQATVDGATIKLSQAQNIYVIDTTGRKITIKQGSISDFKVYESLYDEALDDIKVTIDGVETTATRADSQCAADYVYARIYEGMVVDLVIVKGVAGLMEEAAPPIEEPDPEPEIAANYGYITATALDTDVLTGANTAIIQMVTADGLKVYNVKATNAKINGVVFDADAAGAAATLTALENTVVKYTKNSSNLITSITSADVEDDFVSVAQSGTQTYDAENGKFDNFYLDADALVFFIAADAEDSFIGTVADLEDETPYTVNALYADEKAEDNNILVVAGGVGTISPKTNMGVLTAIGTSLNEDGEYIYSIEAMINGETISADTTADVYNSLWYGLTVGDIIKVKVGRNGLISALEIIYDFAEGVRSFDATLASMDVTAAEGTPSTVKEEYVGGKVTNYKESSTQATVDGATIKLSQAQNVYVIDANGRSLSVKKGGSFKAYESLYKAGLANVKVSIDGVDVTPNPTQAEAQKAADYVYARVYDGNVVDLVIVKGIADMRVADGDSVPSVYTTDSSEYYSLNTMSADDNAISLFAATEPVTVNVTNLTLTGEMAENYNLVASELYSTINEENIATLTIIAENGTVTGAESGKYLFGSSITATAAPNLGYTFKGWYKAGRCVCVEESYEFVLSANTELTVLFERIDGLSDCGTDESGINWYLYESGLLETEGTGTMYDYSSTAIIPWYFARANITEAVIGEGITHIGDRSFYNCISLKKIVIPESVTSIGTYAFKNCEELTIYGIPGSYAETYANENGIPFVEYVKLEKLNKITVDMTESTQNWYFDVSVDKIKYAANVYVAIYDENNRMISVSADSLSTDDLTTILIPKNSDATYAKAYIFKTDVSPAAISKKIDF